MKTELLAPAKNKEVAFSAIDCGADAIYIGAPLFGARINVANSIEDIKEVVDYAHKYWVKVFVAMNTILTNSELDEALKIIEQLQKIGVDALIIQDMGLLKKCIDLKISLPIHISTQCDNYLPEKIMFFNKIGVSRVVLARELSIEQISKIHKENPNLELEAFVHGALCVSMSGQCYLSQYIGGRSANRGECAQPCRKKYTIETTDGKVIKKDFYALCLKDFNASKYLEEIKQAGVFSFKIEGRLKDKSYVKNIVSYYRQKLGKGTSSGISIYPYSPNPEKSFNRGFTDYFLNCRTNCYNQESPKSKGEYLGIVTEVKKDCFKIKTNKKLSPQDGIYHKELGFAINKISNNYIYPNHKINLKIGDRLWRNFDVEFEKSLQKPVKRQIGVNVIISQDIKIEDEDGVCIIEKFPKYIEPNNPEKIKDIFIRQFSKTGNSDFYIKNIQIKNNVPFLQITEINQLRRSLFEKLMNARLDTYNNKIKQTQKQMNYTKFFIDKVDYRANIHNDSAKEFYQNCNTEVIENSFESSHATKKIELMRCKHCIKYALKMCKSPQKLILRDDRGKVYNLEFDCKNCEMKIISN